jgi:membrane associated rhomboid family serine protease
VSAIFLHSSVLHIFFNCLWASRAGAEIERQLGRARFVVLFMVSGIIGFLASRWWSPLAYTVGASGAVFGLFGCAVGVAYARRDPRWKAILVENLVWVAIIGLINMRATGGGVNNAAHAGGLAAGALLGFLFTKEPRRLRLDVPFGILAALLLALTAASIALSAASPYWKQIRAIEITRSL